MLNSPDYELVEAAAPMSQAYRGRATALVTDIGTFAVFVDDNDVLYRLADKLGLTPIDLALTREVVLMKPEDLVIAPKAQLSLPLDEEDPDAL